MAETMLKEGRRAPDFDVLDGDGVHHRLADYRGHKLLLYFYGEDFTPG